MEEDTLLSTHFCTDWTFWNYVNALLIKKSQSEDEEIPLKSEYKQKQMNLPVFQMNNITTLKGNNNNLSNLGTCVETVTMIIDLLSKDKKIALNKIQ